MPINEIPAKRTDLLLEFGEKETIKAVITTPPENKKEEQTTQQDNTAQSTTQRREELEKKQLDIETQQEELKKISSTNEREIKGINLYESGRVEIMNNDTAKVQSQNVQKEYLVNSNEGTCQCKDHEFRGEYGIICIHRVAEQLERIKYDLKKQQQEEKEKENTITTANNDVTFASMCS